MSVPTPYKYPPQDSQSANPGAAVDRDGTQMSVCRLLNVVDKTSAVSGDQGGQSVL